FKEKMFNEIPFFVDYLLTRSIFHEKKTRTWFDHKLIMDENFKKLIQSSKELWKSEIDEVITLIFEESEGLEFIFTPKHILNSLKQLRRNCTTQLQMIRDYLQREHNLTASIKTEYFGTFELTYDLNINEIKGVRGRPFRISR